MTGWALWPVVRVGLAVRGSRPIAGVLARAAAYVPLGYIVAAVLPLYRTAGLHVVFIGGLALTIVAAPFAGRWTFSLVAAFTCFALPLPAGYRAVSACP